MLLFIMSNFETFVIRIKNCLWWGVTKPQLAGTCLLIIVKMNSTRTKFQEASQLVLYTKGKILLT